ncbi:MAG: ABC transporter permease [Thaumarchaeota archaeon]|nr:ABC transporter permease [Nitrososphaerota archaeon]
MEFRNSGQKLAKSGRVFRLYAKSKIGVIGLVIIVFFVLLAVFSPTFAPNHPVNYQVAQPFDIPSWAVIFPQYSATSVDRYPVIVNGFSSQSDLSQWAISGSNLSLKVVPGLTPDTLTVPGSLSFNASISGPLTPEERNETQDPLLPGGITFISLSKQFQFDGVVPHNFDATVVVELANSTNLDSVYVNMVVSTPKGNFSMSSIGSSSISDSVLIYLGDQGTWKTSIVLSAQLPTSGIPAYANVADPSPLVFNASGTYKFTVELRGHPSEGSTSSSMSANIAAINLHLAGGAYGLLGTDNFGNDVWAQLVWGSRISLLIGLLSGVGAVGLGALAGIAAGYSGGIWDEALGRLTDFILVLPFLPVLIIAVQVITSSEALLAGIYFWIVAIFVGISWPFIAKLIRAQVLSVKERQYVEASVAVGGGTGHILRRHILPNVMGLVYSQVALNVAGFILLEAALDFLSLSVNGIGTISWGLMLTYALSDAVSNSAASYVWWWFLPPGVAIATLSLAFVLVGYALDQIFNPRLRAR